MTMTKSTLNALVAGGGLLATWLAVTPSAPTPAGQHPPTVDTTAAVARDVTANDLNLQEAMLRRHLDNVAVRRSARNPFRFGRSKAAAAPSQPQPVAAAPAPVVAAGPALFLSGIATDKGKHTAIISGEGQLYLAGEGELIAGRYRVVSVERDAVTLRDDGGIETRLVLR